MPLSPPAPADATSALLAAAKRDAAGLYAPIERIFVRGEGAWLVDSAGARVLDFAGGMGVNLLGHNHPHVVKAIKAQADRLLHTSNALLSETPVALATSLAQRMHGGQSFFVNSGTEAMEGALKLVRMFHHVRGAPRHRIVACLGGFHGRTMGALSVTGQPKMQQGFGPLLEGVQFVPYDDVPAATAAINEHTAAVIVEPIQGNGGVRLPSPGYLQALRCLTRQNGALLVHDEVQTGMGRCGAWLAADACQVVPDIVCLAKALGGGLPLGAVVAPAAIMAAFAQGSHGSTFGGNPVACAAALATIDVIERDKLLARAGAVGEALRTRLEALPQLRAVRGRGLLWGVEPEAANAAEIRRRCLAEGLLTTQAGPDVVRLFVPAIVTEDDLDVACRALGRALRCP